MAEGSVVSASSIPLRFFFFTINDINARNVSK